jgi:hypothetical protein
MTMVHHVANSLLPLGLSRTLLATPTDQGFSIAHADRNRTDLALVPLGVVACTRAAIIGRVGPPDTHLDVRWRASLTFYGKRFDEFSAQDRDWVLRRQIATSPLSSNIRQIARDDQFALTGSYYAIFRAILNLRQGLPVVLLRTMPSTQDSLPVALLNFRDSRLAHHFAELSRRFLAPEAAEEALLPPAAIDGLEVAELSEEDALRYFGPV